MCGIKDFLHYLVFIVQFYPIKNESTDYRLI